MNELKRVLPIVIAHCIVAAAACFLFAFLKALPSSLIPPFVFGYRLRVALLQFTYLLPVLYVSGILLGYSIAFGKFSNHGTSRWSSELFESLKGAFILSLAAVSFYIVLAEGASPFMESSLKQYETLSDDYAGNLSVAAEFRSSGRYAEAELHANAALQIWPKSADAARLLNEIRYDAADSTGSGSVDAAASQYAAAQRSPGASKLTVLDAIELSRSYTESEDFFSAHYYAMLAYKLARDTDPNKQVALRAAADAWNSISNMPDSAETRSDSRLFSLKRKGYDAIQREDWLTAYYIFSSLQEEELLSDDGLYDPDVERMFEVAREGLIGSYFFMDETAGVEPFEAARDVFFINSQDDGSIAAVFFRGIAYKKESGRDMAYLRGFEYALFDVYNECLYRISVPYVKMLPFKDQNGRTVPELLLHSVDRTSEGVESVPDVLSGSIDETLRNTLLLDMPYSDMHLVISANRGVRSMTLADLLRFTGKASKYGLSLNLIQSEIVYRLTQPFLILILSVLALIIAWKFRFTPNMVFKAWWTIFVPAIPAVSWFAVDSARYLLRLLTVPVVAWFPSFPVPVMLAACTIVFIAASLAFFGQRGE